MAFNVINLLKDRNLISDEKAKYHFEEEEMDLAIATSLLGTPIFSNLVFEPLDYRDSDDVLQHFECFRLDTCLMDAETENTIIMTNIQGRNGSVKELINNGDYRISVQGFLFSPNGNRFPVEQQKQLAALNKVTSSVRVVSSFLNALDIFEVVVNTISFAEIEATRNLVAVSIAMTSETPIEIRLA